MILESCARHIAVATVVISTLLASEASSNVNIGWGPDKTWHPTQVNGVGAIACCAIGSTGDVFVGNRGKIDPILVLDSTTGARKSSFGLGDIKTIHGMKVQEVSGASFLWVADAGNSTVLKYELPSGKLISKIGSKGTGVSPFQFGSVADIAFDSMGAIYVSDGDGGINSRVSKFAANGSVMWVAGNNGTRPVGGLYNSPHSLAYDSSRNRLLVADRGNHTVRILNPATGAEMPNEAWKAIFKYPGSGAVGCDLPAVWSIRVNQNTKQAFVGTSTFGSGSDCANTDPERSEIVVVDLQTDSALATIPVQQSQTNPVGFPHEICVDAKRDAVYAAAVDAPTSTGINALSRYVSAKA